MSSRNSTRVKTIIPRVGGILMIVTAFVCLFFGAAGGIWSPLGQNVFHISLADPYTRSVIGASGVLAFALGFTAGIASLFRRFFWLAVICGGLLMIPAWMTFGIVAVIFGNPIRYLSIAALGLAPVGWALVAVSKKEFSN